MVSLKPETLQELRTVLSTARSEIDNWEQKIRAGGNEPDPLVLVQSHGAAFVLATFLSMESKDERDIETQETLELKLANCRENLLHTSFYGFDNFARKHIKDTVDKLVNENIPEIAEVITLSELNGVARMLVAMTGKDSDIKLAETITGLLDLAVIKLYGGPENPKLGSGPVFLQ